MKKKKRKIRLKSIIILLLIILIIASIVYYFRSKRVNNIYVKGNTFLKESYILEQTGLINYPKIIEINTKKLEEKLLNEPLINKVSISKTIFGKVVVNIEENIPLLKMSDNVYILSNGEMEEYSLNAQVPYLLGEVDANIYDDFIKKFLLIDKNTLVKISEVEYAKTDLDNERFLLYMNDGNLVYVTLSKIELINSYNEIYPTLENKKGILYLDSGNHFEIKSEKN